MGVNDDYVNGLDLTTYLQMQTHADKVRRDVVRDIQTLFAFVFAGDALGARLKELGYFEEFEGGVVMALPKRAVLDTAMKYSPDLRKKLGRGLW